MQYLLLVHGKLATRKILTVMFIHTFACLVEFLQLQDVFLNQSSQTEDGGVTFLRNAGTKKARSRRHYINDETSWVRLHGILSNMSLGRLY